MTYPVDVSLRTIEIGVPFRLDALGTDVVAGSCKLVVTCNEGPLINISTSRTAFKAPIVTNAYSIQVPRTDNLTVWRDKYGKALTTSPTHTYRVDFYVQHDLNWELVRSWLKVQVPAGAGNLDLDTIVETDTPYTVTS